jgi:hypothetical protein
MNITKFAVAAVLTIGVAGTASAGTDIKFATETAAVCAGVMVGQNVKTKNPMYDRASMKFMEQGMSFVRQGYLTETEFKNIGINVSHAYITDPNKPAMSSVTRTCNDMAQQLGYFN